MEDSANYFSYEAYYTLTNALSRFRGDGTLFRGDLGSVTDSSGNTTSYAYGTELSKTFGVPSSITDAKGTTMTQTVDTFGRITYSSVANLNQIYYTYNSSQSC